MSVKKIEEIIDLMLGEILTDEYKLREQLQRVHPLSHQFARISSQYNTIISKRQVLEELINRIKKEKVK